MGKLTLLLVGATILGGSLLTYSTRQLAGEGEADLREQQADLLSRQISESGHAVVLASIVGESGFTAASDQTRSYEGGSYRVEYSPSSTPTRATFVVSGDYAGATHTIKSEYEWDPMSYPGPIWLDVPYVTASAASGADVSGGQVRFDRRKHDALGLQSLAGLGSMESSLGTEIGKTGGSYDAGRSAGSWNWLLEDLNVSDGEDLYQAALIQAPETVIAGPLAVSNNRTNIGEKDEVTHVTGDLLIAKKGKFTGEGALVIDGGLDVEDGGKLDWTGIVIVRDEEQFLPVRLNGDVSITGGLVVVQHAYPPGGHMDVTTWRDLNAGIKNSNVRGAGTSAPWNNTDFPWLQHKHRFDEDLGTRRVNFLEDGNAVPTQEDWTRFEDTIDQLGSESIYLEFQNTGRHGYGVFNLDVDGMAEPLRGMVRDGFDSFARGSGWNRFMTANFDANDLNDFSIDVRSLRTLQDRFDGQGGCVEWPYCIGERADRGGALRVRIRKASGRVVYESALYWHMKASDWADYQAKEAAWRAQIQSGGLFGTRLEMGKKVDIEMDMAPILDLVERLGFDGNEVIHVETETSHSTRDQNVALATRPDGKIEVCHQPDTAATTLAVEPEGLRTHLAHGDRILACDGTPANASASPSPLPSLTPPNCLTAPASITICNKPGGGGGWYDRTVACDKVASHIAHGCKMGSCALNGLEPPTCPSGDSPEWEGGKWECDD